MYESFRINALANHWIIRGYEAGVCVGTERVVATSQNAAIELGLAAFRGVSRGKVRVTAEPVTA